VTARRTVRRILLVWLAVELTAGILAIALLVAVLPWIALLLLAPPDPWVASGVVLALSVPVAVVLARSALGIPRGLLLGESVPEARTNV